MTADLRGHRRAVTDRLPQAHIVADYFHLVRLGNAAVAAVRQRVTRDDRVGEAQRSTPGGSTGTEC
jgi:transposase